IKDRQYTMQPDSLPRRSAQTALYHIIQAFTRWLAPILSFTADELYEHIPGQRGESIFLEELYPGLEDLLRTDPESTAAVEALCAVKMEVNRALEMKRAAGELGSSLEAEITLYADENLASALALFGDELRFALITSAALVVEGVVQAPVDAVATEMRGLKLLVQKSAHDKCIRCWHHRADVGRSPEHPALCSRCIENIDGGGETREFA
ncbi:MAG: class I tRNA ligase family protein, partial [Pseudomonadales bacterium]